MNKQQITKPYAIILLCLALASALILFATPFVSAFEMDLGLISKSETGMDYIENLLDQEEYDGTDKNNDFSYSDSSGLLIEDAGIILFMYVLLFVLFGFAIANCVKALFSLSNKDLDSAIGQRLSVIKSGLGFNLAYFVFCMYIILEGHEWNFKLVFSGNALVTTNTYIPLIFQLIVFAASMVVYGLWRKKVVSLIWGGEDYAQTTSNARIEQAPNYTNDTPQSARSEMEILELLKKYKELLDLEIITEEEFNAKKKELLSAAPQNAVTPSTEPPTEMARQSTAERLQTGASSAKVKSDRACPKCGHLIPPTQSSCSICGTRLIAEDSYSLKWYKFLIYFSLFASAILNLIMAIVYFSGADYGGKADLVYATFPAMRVVDILYSVMVLGLAIMALITRQALARKKKIGPGLLYGMDIVIIGVSVLYAMAVAAIANVNAFENGYLLYFLLVSVIRLIINYVYFRKRERMFIY